jgi:hypothetical protein
MELRLLFGSMHSQAGAWERGTLGRSADLFQPCCGFYFLQNQDLFQDLSTEM